MIPDLRDTILNTWRTNNRVTVFLAEHLPAGLWAATVPGAPGRTIRMIAGHLHNAPCMWIKTLGQKQGLPVPRSVDRRRVGRRELVPALQRSSRGILRLTSPAPTVGRPTRACGRRRSTVAAQSAQWGRRGSRGNRWASQENKGRSKHKRELHQNRDSAYAIDGANRKYRINFTQ